MSATESLTIGSALSVRGTGRMGSRMSIFNLLNLGSSVSVRSHARFGSGLSVKGGFFTAGNLGTLSTFDTVTLSSSLSMRSFGRVSGMASVLNVLNLGSSLSVRSFSRCGSSLSVVGTVRVGNSIHIGHAENEIRFIDGTFNGKDTAYAFFARDTSGGSTAQTRRMTFGRGTTNYLHGTWQSDTTITTTSDRRIKKNIRPLYKALLDEHIRLTGTSSIKESVADWNTTSEMKIGEEPYASQLFRKLRPVAYSLKTDHESKRTNFGFIAQELMQIYPSVVSEDASSGSLSVSYNDIIAVITLTVQQEMTRLDLVEKMVERVEDVASNHTLILQDSDTKITALEEQLRALKETYTVRVQKILDVQKDADDTNK